MTNRNYQHRISDIFFATEIYVIKLQHLVLKQNNKIINNKSGNTA